MDWGYILVGPGRPSGKDQLSALLDAGLKTKNSAFFRSDTIRKGRPGYGGGRTQLTGRSALLEAMMRGDTLIVAEPFCAGISGHDVRLFLRELRSRGVMLKIPDGQFEVGPDQDGSALVREISRRQNRAHRLAWERNKKT